MIVSAGRRMPYSAAFDPHTMRYYRPWCLGFMKRRDEGSVGIRLKTVKNIRARKDVCSLRRSG